MNHLSISLFFEKHRLTLHVNPKFIKMFRPQNFIQKKEKIRKKELDVDPLGVQMKKLDL